MADLIGGKMDYRNFGMVTVLLLASLVCGARAQNLECAKVDTFPLAEYASRGTSYTEEEINRLFLTHFDVALTELSEADISRISTAFGECAAANGKEMYQDFYPAAAIKGLIADSFTRVKKHYLEVAESNSVEQKNVSIDEYSERVREELSSFQAPLRDNQIAHLDALQAEALKVIGDENNVRYQDIALIISRLKIETEQFYSAKRIEDQKEQERVAYIEMQRSKQAEEEHVRRENEAKQAAKDVRDPTLLLPHITVYLFAEYCSEYDSYFTTEEIEDMKMFLDKLSAQSQAPESEKRRMWDLSRQGFAQKKDGIHAGVCADAKKKASFMFPKVTDSR